MFHNSNGELVSKTEKVEDGVNIVLKYYLSLDEKEISRLKEFRENYAKTSPVHFNFNEGNFFFSQKKYYKKFQFITEPPKLDKVEKNFLMDVKTVLNRYKNFLHFAQIENLEKRNKINLKEIFNLKEE